MLVAGRREFFSEGETMNHFGALGRFFCSLIRDVSLFDQCQLVFPHNEIVSLFGLCHVIFPFLDGFQTNSNTLFFFKFIGSENGSSVRCELLSCKWYRVIISKFPKTVLLFLQTHKKSSHCEQKLLCSPPRWREVVATQMWTPIFTEGRQSKTATNNERLCYNYQQVDCLYTPHFSSTHSPTNCCQEWKTPWQYAEGSSIQPIKQRSGQTAQQRKQYTVEEKKC